jgi:hypothetical protein
MVLGVFERFQAKWLTEHEKKFFRFFLVLHDIGKPLAIEKTGDKQNQSQFTTPLLQAALEQCQFEQRWITLAVEFEKYDILGQCLKDQLTTCFPRGSAARSLRGRCGNPWFLRQLRDESSQDKSQCV